MSLINQEQFKVLYQELLKKSLEKGRITDFNLLYSEISTKFNLGAPITQNYLAIPMEEISPIRMREFFKGLVLDRETCILSNGILQEHSNLIVKGLTNKIENMGKELLRLRSKAEAQNRSSVLFNGDFKSFSNFDRSSDVFFDTSGTIRTKSWLRVKSLKDFDLNCNSKDCIKYSYNEILLKFGSENTFKLSINCPEKFNYIHFSVSDGVVFKFTDDVERSFEAYASKGMYLNSPTKTLELTVSLLSSEIKPIVLRLVNLGFKNEEEEKGTLTSLPLSVPEKTSSIFIESDYLGNAWYTSDSINYPISINSWIPIKTQNISRDLFNSSQLSSINWGNLKQRANSIFAYMKNSSLFVGWNQVEINAGRGNITFGKVRVGVEDKNLNETLYNPLLSAESGTLTPGINVLCQRDNPIGIYKEMVIPVSLNIGTDGQFLVPGNKYKFNFNVEVSEDWAFKDCILTTLQGIIPIGQVNNPNYTDSLISTKILINGETVVTNKDLSYLLSDTTVDYHPNKFDINFKKGVNTFSIELEYKDINASVRDERSVFADEPYIQVCVYPSLFDPVFSNMGIERVWGGEQLRESGLNDILNSPSSNLIYALDSERNRILIQEDNSNLDGRIKSSLTNYLIEGEVSSGENMEISLGFNFEKNEDSMSKLKVYGR